MFPEISSERCGSVRPSGIRLSRPNWSLHSQKNPKIVRWTVIRVPENQGQREKSRRGRACLAFPQHGTISRLPLGSFESRRRFENVAEQCPGTRSIVQFELGQ